ncbi:MAG TPA: DUF6544 family protein [Flavipsychrobacter sp.]
MKYIFALLIILHALLHLLGFVKEFKLAQISQLSGDTLVQLSDSARRFSGTLWIVACVVFLVAAGQYLRGSDSWWIWALSAAILSQVLIVLYWHDAKAGTVANIIILAVAVFGYGQWSFNRMVYAEAEKVITELSKEDKIVTVEMVQDLPAPVQHWLRSSGVVGKPLTYNLRLKQTGKMRTAPSQPWMAVEAEQYFNVEEPAFVWQVHARMKGMPVNGRDKYMDGQGNMLIMASGLIRIVDGSGMEINQGSMLRYMGEVCWFPSAALSKYISWEEIDSNRARMVMNYKGLNAEGICTFDGEGRLLRFDAKRYMGSGNDATLNDWYAVCLEWKEMDGIIIPVKGTVNWQLPEGPFDYYHYTITELEYNIDERW